VLEELLKSDSLHRVALQQLGDEGMAAAAESGGNVLREAGLCALYVVEQLQVVGAIERGLASNQLKQDGADRPQISLENRKKARRVLPHHKGDRTSPVHA
jgi:hypothetical protein